MDLNFINSTGSSTARFFSVIKEESKRDIRKLAPYCLNCSILKTHAEIFCGLVNHYNVIELTETCLRLFLRYIKLSHFSNSS